VAAAPLRSSTPNGDFLREIPFMGKLIKSVRKIELFFTMIVLFVLVSFVFEGAIARYFKRPTNLTYEMSSYLFAWLIFLSGDLAFHDNRLVNLNFLIQRLPLWAIKIVGGINYAFIIFFFLMMIVLGVQLTITSVDRTFAAEASFSYSWLTVCIPIGSFFMLITAVCRFFMLIKLTDRNELSNM
jgi:TRAP-type C4-dicarboxylate transport system permease small subunit